MSVSVHEAFCLDSFQDRLLFWDDFEGDQVKDEWTVTVVGGGTAVVVDAQTGGIVRLATGGVLNDSVTLTWNSIKTLRVDKKVTIEVRAKLNNVTYQATLLNLFKGFNDQIYIGTFNNGAGGDTYIIYSEDDGATTNVNTTEAVDADWHIFRIECFPTGEIHYFKDGIEFTNSPITTNIPADADDYLEVKLEVVNIGVADDRTLDIDYVYIRQER